MKNCLEFSIHWWQEYQGEWNYQSIRCLMSDVWCLPPKPTLKFNQGQKNQQNQTLCKSVNSAEVLSEKKTAFKQVVAAWVTQLGCRPLRPACSSVFRPTTRPCSYHECCLLWGWSFLCSMHKCGLMDVKNRITIPVLQRWIHSFHSSNHLHSLAQHAGELMKKFWVKNSLKMCVNNNTRYGMVCAYGLGG